MNYLVENFGTFGAWTISAVLLFFRYLVFAGLAFCIFYIFKKRHFIKKKIQQKFPQKKQVLFEIGHSVVTALIFALVGLGIYYMQQNGIAKIYTDAGEYGHAWLVLSFVLLAVVNDTWFYWLHRLMHHPRLFRAIHLVHHRSNNPTPWAAFSFHPIEAVVEIAFLPILVCIVPVHSVVIILFSLFSLSFNVVGHLGFELFPKGFTRHPYSWWLNTSTHHNLHHQRSSCNYGLYFNFWDRMMGTNHPDYHEIFDGTGSEVRGRG